MHLAGDATGVRRFGDDPRLREHGPTPHAFSFREHFAAAAAGASVEVDDDRWMCPA